MRRKYPELNLVVIDRDEYEIKLNGKSYGRVAAENIPNVLENWDQSEIRMALDELRHHPDHKVAKFGTWGMFIFSM